MDCRETATEESAATGESRSGHDFKLRQSNVRYASRGERSYGDRETGSEFSDDRSRLWGDRVCDQVAGGEGTIWQKRQQGSLFQPRQVVKWNRNRNMKPVSFSERDQASARNFHDTVSSLKRFVTFYITNFPPQASTFFLRKGFKVCGILEDVFIANNRNRSGEVYGFVCYAKVQDVDKLLKAVNNVCFGQYCVRAVLARFDRKRGKFEKEAGEGGGGRRSERGEGEGEVVLKRRRVLEGEKNEKGRELEGRLKEGGELEGEGGVRVGSVLVKVGGLGKEDGEGDGGKEERFRVQEKTVRMASTAKTNLKVQLLKKYTPCEEDLKWAL